jgi:hypothetical protein
VHAVINACEVVKMGIKQGSDTAKLGSKKQCPALPGTASTFTGQAITALLGKWYSPKKCFKDPSDAFWVNNIRCETSKAAPSQAR